MKNLLFNRLAEEAGVLVASGDSTYDNLFLLPVLVKFRRNRKMEPEVYESNSHYGSSYGAVEKYIEVGIEWLEENLTGEELAELAVLRMEGNLNETINRIYPEGWIGYTGGLPPNWYKDTVQPNPEPMYDGYTWSSGDIGSYSAREALQILDKIYQLSGGIVGSTNA